MFQRQRDGRWEDVTFAEMRMAIGWRAALGVRTKGEEWRSAYGVLYRRKGGA